VSRPETLLGRPGLAPEAWWLATTSRWRTTEALRLSPTKPVPCSRFREHCETPLSRASRCSRPASR